MGSDPKTPPLPPDRIGSNRIDWLTLQLARIEALRAELDAIRRRYAQRREGTLESGDEGTD